MTWWLRTTYSRAKYGLVYCRVSVGTIQTGQGAVYQDYHMYTQLKWNSIGHKRKFSIGHKRKFLGPCIQDQYIVQGPCSQDVWEDWKQTPLLTTPSCTKAFIETTDFGKKSISLNCRGKALLLPIHYYSTSYPQAFSSNERLGLGTSLAHCSEKNLMLKASCLCMCNIARYTIPMTNILRG